MDLPPELRYLVAGYLEPKDALTCLHVNRAWHDTFSEWAFKFARMRFGCRVRDRVPSMEWMQHYGSFIEELDLDMRCILPLSPLGEQEPLPYNHRKQDEPLLPKLTKLFFRSSCSLTEAEAWLSHCPNLVSLALTNVESLPTTDIHTGKATLAKDRGSRLLRHCPRLTRLEIDNQGRGFSGSPLKPNDLVEIINHWPPLMTQFSLVDDGISRPWFTALSGFLERMTTLNFYNCRVTEGWMLRKILSSCPHLVELDWSTFDVHDLFIEQDVGRAVATSLVAATNSLTTTPTATTGTTTPLVVEEEGALMAPWACTGLRRFTLFTIAWSESPFRNRAAMEYLGLLKDLRRLTVDVMSGDVDYEEYPWPEIPRAYLIEDLQTLPGIWWMRETWPSLEHFELQRWSWI